MNQALSLLLPKPSLGLNPEDYFWATWREHVPLACPEAESFDQDVAIVKLRKAKTSKSKRWHWEQAEIPLKMTKPEAQFWLEAILYSDRTHRIKDMINHLQSRSFTGKVEELTLTCSWDDSIIALPLYYLDPIEAFLPALAGEMGHSDVTWLMNGFRRYVLPYLAIDELNHLRQVFREQSEQGIQCLQGRAAVTLGVWPGLQIHVESLRSEDCFRWGDEHRQVFGLDNADIVQIQMQRLHLKLINPDQVRAWLAHTEFRGLDWVCDSIKAIRGEKKAKDACAMFEVFAQVRCLEMPKHMLSLIVSSQVSGAAKEWLRKNPEWAIAGLLPIATGRSKLATLAMDWIQQLHLEGHGELVQAIVGASEPAVVEKIQPRLDLIHHMPVRSEEDLPEVFQKMRYACNHTLTKDEQSPLIWSNLAVLPKIETVEFSLPDSLIKDILLYAQKQYSATPDLIKDFKEQVSEESLDRFLWALFQQMHHIQISGYLINILGNLGSDSLVAKLIQYDPKYVMSRDVIGVLSLIATDVALQHIQRIKYAIADRTCQAQAEEHLDYIAKEQGISITILEDRLVPGLGFDAQNSRHFEFGRRRFTAMLDPHLQVVLKDEAGKLRSNLPKPTQKDDALIAQTAIADWKVWKPEVEREIKLQAVRLERSMARGLTWHWEAFRASFLERPLMNAIARTLLWTGMDTLGQVLSVFQLSEDSSLVGIEGEAVSPQGVEHICITHPATLTQTERSLWGEILSDYDIIQPFPQIGRPTEVGILKSDSQNVFTYETSNSTFLISLNDRFAKLGWQSCYGWKKNVWRNYCLELFGVVAIVVCDHANRDYNNRVVNELMFIPIDRLDRTKGRMSSIRSDTAPLPLEHIPNQALSEVFYQLSLITRK
jgi:Domain of unknown function (DUF4132)